MAATEMMGVPANSAGCRLPNVHVFAIEGMMTLYVHLPCHSLNYRDSLQMSNHYYPGSQVHGSGVQSTTEADDPFSLSGR